MAGLEKLLKSILKYQTTLKSRFASRLSEVEKNPKILTGLMVSCMDARVNVPKMLSQDLGEAFHIKNAGNFIPHYSTVTSTSISTESAGLELACVVRGVPDVVVFGHSDCKAMIGLHDSLKSDWSVDDSPLKMWISRHGSDSLTKYRKFIKKGGPVGFKEAHTPFEAIIDKQLPDYDQLSQINTLQQLENISSYPFLVERLKNSSLKTHAVWLDLSGGEVYVFSRKLKMFGLVTDENIKDFM